MTRALPVALLPLVLAACGPSLATRYETGNQALSQGDGAMYFVVISPILRDALNACIPQGTPGASPTLVVVADVDADGHARNLEVRPRSPGSDCLREHLASRPLPRPPLAPAAATFPIGLRIDTK
ncbi:MAG: hypothetical protein ACRETF_08005 [Nevskiaceae bacterium]